MKDAKAAAKQAVEESEPSGGGMSLMDDLAPSAAGGGDSGALADELDKVRNRMESLLSKSEHQKELKALKSTLAKEMERANEKIDEVSFS